eukprot:16242951-Heterocapsa_arctica.AAC.1
MKIISQEFKILLSIILIILIQSPRQRNLRRGLKIRIRILILIQDYPPSNSPLASLRYGTQRYSSFASPSA